MQIRKRLLRSATIFVSLTLPVLAAAQTGGAVPIRIPDGADSRCINAAQDRIWLTMRRAILDKKSGWLKEDSHVSSVIEAQLRDPARGKPISFPLISQTKLEGFTNGQVSLPIEFTVIDGFSLAKPDGTKPFTGATIEITLLNQQKKSDWGNALTALAEVADKVPFPAGPLTSSILYILDFASSALDKDIERVNADDKSRSATISLNFHPTGQCAGAGFETTGTIAILSETGIKGPTYIDVNTTNSYCWNADLQPAFVLQAVRKDPARPCTDTAFYGGKYWRVSNNYVGFFLNAVAEPATPPDTGKLDLYFAGLHTWSNDLQAAVRRCEAHGIRNCAAK